MLSRFHGTDLVAELRHTAERVQALVPDCLGMSIAVMEEGLAFTLVASDDEIAVLDAIQYVVGGPCVAAVEAGHGLALDTEDLLDEDRWQTFGLAAASAAVRSTLTLPIVEGGKVVGTVNLYGGSSRAFTGHHEELAELFGAVASLAVTNADLGFRSREIAQRAPGRLRRSAVIDQATGILAARSGLDVGTARERLLEAAERAGVDVLQVAEAVIEARSRDRRP